MSECGFEGVEKKLVVSFTIPKNNLGLRIHQAAEWQVMLDAAKCTIISSRSNEHLDSYVLSESSLFVYANKVIIKTCGTTRLLDAIPEMRRLGELAGLQVASVFYCRKNFLFPEHQPHPHRSFDDEVQILNSHFSQGKTSIMGPAEDEHWCYYISDLCGHTSANSQVQILEVMMLDLDRERMEQFYKNEKFVSAHHTTVSSGISNLLPGSVSDETFFDPCGYSVNGLLDSYYYTIHVTPEPECSFVSFETNAPIKARSELVSKVLQVFRPGRFSVAVLAGSEAALRNELTSEAHPFFIGYGNTFSASEEAKGRITSFSHYVSDGLLLASAGTPAQLIPSVIDAVPEFQSGSISQDCSIGQDFYPVQVGC